MLNKDLEMSKKIAYAVKEKSGTAYYVGGYVRDLLRGIENKDIDMEIHGIGVQTCEEILDSVGKRINVGKSFGVYNLKGYNIDIALPRSEILAGNGHKDFNISVDPFIGTKKAAMRRDFTVNSIMQNVITNELVDHFNGLEDIKNKCIRHINDEKFSEDALRVLRGAQFASRFDFDIAPETKKLFKKIPLHNLSKERVAEEMKKALLKSERPSAFFEVLKDTNQLDVWFKELKELIGVKQSMEFHPEGDVWTHTMLTLDFCVNYRNLVNDPLSFMISALCHDMGKPICTTFTNGKIHSYRHELYGVDIAEKFVDRIFSENAIKQYVMNMVRYHMRPYVLSSDKSSVKATNNMFDKFLFPEDGIYFSLADNGIKANTEEFKDNKSFLFERLEIYEKTMHQPFVTGKDLIEFGFEPGENMGEALKFAHKLRLAGISKEIALKETTAYLKKINRY